MISGKTQVAANFIESVKADRAAKQLHETPNFTLENIISTLDLCKSETNGILNLPPPPKPKEEEKKEEIKEENKDVKMEGDTTKPEGDK